MISKQIAKTRVRNYLVSTVQLPGFDDDEIEQFETMVFRIDELDRWHDVDLQRYLTELEAVEGHKKMVEEWSNK